MVQFLVTISKLWLGMAITVSLIALIGKVESAGIAWLALMGALAWFNLGNTGNFVTEVLLFSPAVGAYLLAEHPTDRSAR